MKQENNQLLEQYKAERKKLKKYIREMNKQIIEIDFDNIGSNNKAYYDSEHYLKVYYEEQRLGNLNWLLNNLNYAIKWMESGHEPGIYNGIESTKASEVYKRI